MHATFRNIANMLVQAGADERNGYRDDLNAPAPANPGPPAKASRPQQPNNSRQAPEPAANALDWSQHLKVNPYYSVISQTQFILFLNLFPVSPSVHPSIDTKDFEPLCL